MSVGIFISHSSADNAEAMALDAALRHPRGLPEGAVGVETWLDKWDIGLGHYYAADVVAGQRRSQAAVFLLSDAALASGEVLAEWELAKQHGLSRFAFMPDRDSQLARLPDAWRYHNQRPTLDQVWQWEGAEKAAADVYLELGLPSPLCPCGKSVPYDRCCSRRRRPVLPAKVEFGDMVRRQGGAGLPLGVGEDSEAVLFDAEKDRHLHCVGGMGSGKSNLISVVLGLAARRWPHQDRFLIAAQSDTSVPSAEVIRQAHRPRDAPGVVSAVTIAAAAGRPCLLAIDDLQSLPLHLLTPLAEVDPAGSLHIVCAHALDFRPESRNPTAAFLAAAGMRIQLQAGAFLFGQDARSAAQAGRASVWSTAWEGPRPAQIAVRTQVIR